MMGDYTNGPIVACNNAIEHYTRVLEQQAETTDQLRRKLATSLDAERILDGQLTRWNKARDVLERELVKDNARQGN
jgi:hypothetical protein